MQKLFTKEFRPGEKWSGLIGKNKYIHFKALGDNANVSILLYNMRDTSERYNMPDTLKAQYTAHLTKGNVLMSDNGRVMASITEDSLGWHDSICGHHIRNKATIFTDAARKTSRLNLSATIWVKEILYHA